jgi:hypothetical protein
MLVPATGPWAMMCARSKLDLGFAASSHGSMAGARPSISHFTAAGQDLTVVTDINTHTHTHKSSNHLHFSSSPPPHCSRHYPSTSISHYLRRQAHQASKPSVRDPLETDTSILYSPARPLLPGPANNTTNTPTPIQQQSLLHTYCPPPNAAGSAACPSSTTPHCSDRLRQTPLWGSAPGNLIIQRIHQDCRPSIHPAPAPLPLQHPQWATAPPRTLARTAPTAGVASLPLRLYHPRKQITITM